MQTGTYSGAFDPLATFTCGQCFRWGSDTLGVWSGITGSHRVRLVPAGTYILDGASAAEQRRIWIPYLDWDSDYDAWQSQLSDGDPILAAAIAHAPGLRLLRQDPWETLATFLISQNNGIPRIRSIVTSLCACFGDPAGPGEANDLPAFPSVERIASLTAEDLGVCRAGYRTAYLIKTAQQLACGEMDLAAVGRMPYQEAREALLRLHGVGVKVADCALLFAGTHREAFPVDRWVIRIMNALYPHSGADTSAIQAYAAARWGNLAGLAQEYLFHYARTHQIGVS